MSETTAEEEKANINQQAPQEKRREAKGNGSSCFHQSCRIIVAN
jgi:hypothetical protein